VEAPPRDGCPPYVRFGSRAAVAAGLMAQPVYPQLWKYPSVPPLTLRARLGIQRSNEALF
jgi:hypothetical protein